MVHQTSLSVVVFYISVELYFFCPSVFTKQVANVLLQGRWNELGASHKRLVPLIFWVESLGFLKIVSIFAITMNTVVLNNLSIGYTQKGNEKVVAQGLNAAINSGELTCLLGCNGVGKSTLLRTLFDHSA